MAYMLTIFLIACVLAWLYSRWCKVRSYWAERGVPHLPPNPILGSLTFLQQINAVSSVDEDIINSVLTS